MNVVETVKAIAEKHHFNGAILIGKQDQVLCAVGVGYADKDNQILWTPDTKSRIASISKQITALAVLQLVELQQLTLEDTIDKFFPDYAYGSSITIHQLLANCSGVANFDLGGDYTDLYGETDLYDTFIRKVILPLPLRFQPGSAFEYSGSGYLMLTSIIEKVSGLPYDQYLQKHIFEPLKMNNSGFDFHHVNIEHKAVPYDVKDNQMVAAMDIDLRLGGGGGGLYSTVLDLHKWNCSLKNHPLVSKSLVDLMFTNHIQIIESTGYGYGFFLEETVKDDTLQKVYYHTGGGPGVQAINAFFIHQDITLILLSNVNEKKQFHETREELYHFIMESDILYIGDKHE